MTQHPTSALPLGNLNGQEASAASQANPAFHFDLEKVHLIGVGGSGMSGIARILAGRGAAVSGSDVKESPRSSALREVGVTVHVGHDAANLGDARTVVVSTAIKNSNPELQAARERGLAVRHRAEVLAALMVGQRSIGVAGTAGKTSTTAMLTVVARHAGLDPSFAFGALLHGFGTNAHHGVDPLFIAETDESDNSFLKLNLDIAVVMNVTSDDHLDFHGTTEKYDRSFELFIDRMPQEGLVIVGVDDPGAARLADYARRRVRVRTFGESPEADLRLTDLVIDAKGTTYTASLEGKPLRSVQLTVPGRHMALNSAAALLTALELGISTDDAIEGLATYQGVSRRFEFKGETRGVRVYDDFAHNPTKVREQLRAARSVAAPGRLIAVFQPPTFSKAQRFSVEFGAALGQADEVLVLDVCRDWEKPIPGVTGKLVFDEVPLPSDQVTYCPERPDVVPELTRRVRSGDLVVTLGTGDVTKIGPEFLAFLQESQ